MAVTFLTAELMTPEYIIIVLDCIGLSTGLSMMAIYHPGMYGCIETHWSKKFILGVLLIIVSIAGLVK